MLNIANVLDGIQRLPFVVEDEKDLSWLDKVLLCDKGAEDVEQERIAATDGIADVVSKAIDRKLTAALALKEAVERDIARLEALEMM